MNQPPNENSADNQGPLNLTEQEMNFIQSFKQRLTDSPVVTSDVSEIINSPFGLALIENSDCKISLRDSPAHPVENPAPEVL